MKLIKITKKVKVEKGNPDMTEIFKKKSGRQFSLRNDNQVSYNGREEKGGGGAAPLLFPKNNK